MERFRSRMAASRVVAAVLAGALVIVSGCEDAEETATRRANIGPVGPEESFERIMVRLKRRLEHGPQRAIVGSGLSDDANESSSFSFRDEVSGQVIEPSEEGEPLRAEVIIRTYSDYIHTQTVPDEPKSERNGDADSILDLLNEEGEETSGADALLNPDADSEGKLDFDPFETPESSGSKSDRESTDDRTQTLKDNYETAKRYELVYRDSRWVLETTPEKESLIQIFQYALEGQ